MPTLTQIIADAYRKMVNPPQAVARPKWVPASVNEESVPAFVQAVTEARKANQSVVEFNGKKYGITVKEETNKEDDNKSKKIQDMDAENAPKQGQEEAPEEVKEEDSEEIKVANVADKEKDAEEMQKIAASEAPGDKRAEMAEELVGNQHKLDVNKNGKIDGDDLKKLRGEEKEEDSEEEHPEPDADNMGGPSDNDADNKDEDEVNEKYTAIVTRKNSNGKYDDVGMNNRTIVRGSHSNILKKANEYAKGPHRVELFHGDYIGYGAPHKVIHSESTEVDESTQLTGEQTISSVAATYASMVNENVAGDPHAANLSAKANSATALAHTSHSETHHEDARDAHNLAAEHYRVYAHNHHDPLVRSAANIHHEFHRSMSNHHMLNLVSSDMDKEAHDMAAKHYGKKSVDEGTAATVNEEDEYAGDNPVDKLHLDVPAFIRVLERAREDFKTDEDIHNFTQQLLAMKSDCIHTEDLPSSPVKEGTAADAEAGPEVMDPVTQKAKDDADDETEIKDGVPGAAQDGGDKVSPADKPAAANSSAALPKVPVITAPVTTNEGADTNLNEGAGVNFKHPMNSKKGHLERLAHHAVWTRHHAKYDDGDHFARTDDHHDYAKDHAKAAIEHGATMKDVAHHSQGLFSDESHLNESTNSLEEQDDGTFYDGSDMLGEAQARYSDSYKFTHKPGNAESEKKLADLKAKTKGTGNRVVLQGRLGKNNPNANKYSMKNPAAKERISMSGSHSHQRIAKADAAHHDVYVYRKA